MTARRDGGGRLNGPIGHRDLKPDNVIVIRRPADPRRRRRLVELLADMLDTPANSGDVHRP